jgi:hypothetical protein
MNSRSKATEKRCGHSSPASKILLNVSILYYYHRVLDMTERKGIYLSGKVPIEDDTFRKLLLHNVQYIKRVDHFLTHMDQNPQKSLTLNQLINDRREHTT